MADEFQEKTEQATPRKKQKAREKGQVARSREVPGAMVLIGFLAFGDGPSDARTVKCGIRYRAKKVLIIEGELNGDGASKGADLDAGARIGAVADLRVEVDLAAGSVKLTAGGTVVEATLRRPLSAITHVGYVTDNAVAEFSAIETGPGT